MEQMSDLNDAVRVANAGGDLRDALDAAVAPEDLQQALKAARGEHEQDDEADTDC